MLWHLLHFLFLCKSEELLGTGSPQLGGGLHVLGEGGEEGVVLGEDGGGRGSGGLGGGGGREEVGRVEGERVERELVREGEPGQGRVGEERLLFGGEGRVTSETITHQHRHPQPPGAEPGPEPLEPLLLDRLLSLVPVVLEPDLDLQQCRVRRGVRGETDCTWVGVKLSMLARCSLSGADKYRC